MTRKRGSDLPLVIRAHGKTARGRKLGVNTGSETTRKELELFGDEARKTARQSRGF